MFPDIPVDNVRYDLLRTGSVEQTSNKILERGFLDADQPPPAYYTLFPHDATGTPTGRRPGSNAAGRGNGTEKKKPAESLIERYKLQERLASAEPVPEEQIGGKAVWEDSAEKREASLRERKAQMILAARQSVSSITNIAHASVLMFIP
ncbi:hypothetical protein H0H81_007851 [Sphagnurus paluster]|uniref:CUE domain-containing protein n=1 Tax=Sphagnurus paluster TaxID=117069 RepID=A0A9P7FSI1_9AGAR|nr:hypothetical protein H0H81_007851 [Sphagnurus paluster]